MEYRLPMVVDEGKILIRHVDLVDCRNVETAALLGDNEDLDLTRCPFWT